MCRKTGVWYTVFHERKGRIKAAGAGSGKPLLSAKYLYVFRILNVAEVSDVYAMERELDFVPWKLFGGTEGCERQMLRFGSEETLGYEEAFPISVL